MPFDVHRTIQHAQQIASEYRLKPFMSQLKGQSGSSLGKDAGASMTFHDYREYQLGDDLRQVDWGVYARNDTLVIRRYQEEMSPYVEVFVDNSSSMGFYEGKQNAAIYTAALFSALTRCAHGCPVLLTESGRQKNNEFEQELTRMNFNQTSNPTANGHRSSGRGQPIRAFISDLLYPSDMDAYMRIMGRNAGVLIVVQILSDSERKPLPSGGVRLIDVENEELSKEIRMTPVEIRRYRERLKSHIEMVKQAVNKQRGIFCFVPVPNKFSSLDSIGQAIVGAMMPAGILEIL